MSLVGIIANPASGTDIRRLVAYGSVFINRISERESLADDEAEQLADVLFHGILGKS